MTIWARPIFSPSVTPGSPRTLYVATDTYANLIAAGYAGAGYAGYRFIASDIGPSGSIFKNSNSRLIPDNGRCTAYVLPYPIGIAPTFTGSTNGAITFGTAVPTQVHKGWFYYPANSLVASHAAGFYWTEMSSTTAATVYNNTYTPAAGTLPNEPANKVAFSGAVPGGTGSTGYIDALYFTIPGGLLGEIGAIHAYMFVECNGSAGGKRAQPGLAGNNLTSGSFSSVTSACGTHVTKNYGTGRQRSPSIILNASDTSATVTNAVDTTVNQNYSVQLSHPSAATDIVILSGLSVDYVIPR